MKKLFFVAFAALLLSSCEKEETSQTKIIKIVSDGEIDGTLSNYSTRVFTDYYGGGQGKEIRIGWELNGEAMRGFLSFSIADIIPKSDEVLTINKAYLKVYESNTNLLPFTAGDESRTVEAYLVDCGSTIESSDYDTTPHDSCGTIATTGYSVLTEHAINVETAISEYIAESTTTVDNIQFRLQFTNDTNGDFYDPRSQSYFAIFSGNETHYIDYVPVLEIEYTLKKK